MQIKIAINDHLLNLQKLKKLIAFITGLQECTLTYHGSLIWYDIWGKAILQYAVSPSKIFIIFGLEISIVRAYTLL